MKKLLTAIVLIISVQTTYCQTSQVYGFVTYQSKDHTFKFDEGATLLLITPDRNLVYDAEFNAYEKNVYNQFKTVYDINYRLASLQIKLHRLSSSAYAGEIKRQMKVARKRLKTANENVKKAQQVFVQNINQLFEKYKTLLPDSCRKVIDSKGMFSFEVKPGVYYTLIAKSKNTLSVMHKSGLTIEGRKTELSFVFRGEQYGVEVIEDEMPGWR